MHAAIWYCTWLQTDIWQEWYWFPCYNLAVEDTACKPVHLSLDWIPLGLNYQYCSFTCTYHILTSCWMWFSWQAFSSLSVLSPKLGPELNLKKIEQIPLNTLVCVLFADFTCHSYQHNILEMFLYLVYSFFGRFISYNSMCLPMWMNWKYILINQVTAQLERAPVLFRRVQRMKAQSDQSRTASDTLV